MIIGIPKEIKDNEKRVSLLPHLVQPIADKGHEVISVKKKLNHKLELFIKGNKVLHWEAKYVAKHKAYFHQVLTESSFLTTIL